MGFQKRFSDDIIVHMGDECGYSFWDLFEASHNRKATVKEKKEFEEISQEERNKLVKKWARKANWGVDDRKGTDGQIYTAFCPLWKNKIAI